MRALALIACGFACPASAETIGGALAKAYSDNPELSEQRANVRVRDEDVPRAAAGMRPRANASINGGPQFSRVRQPAGRDRQGKRVYSDDHMWGEPHSGTFSVSQPLFDGGRTGNAMRQAESGVLAARENLRQSEQDTLLNAATAYMNVLRDTAVLALRKSNIAVLVEQLRVARDRYGVGEVTITDVAQAEAALAQAKSDAYAAQGALEISVGNYERVIGDKPKRLDPASSIESMAPGSREEAIEIAQMRHPSVAAALHQVDAAESAVRVAEAALSPNLSVNAQVNQQYDSYLGYPGTKQFSAQISGQLNVPIYQGGGEYASIRQAKEQLGQARLHVSTTRLAARAAVIQAYAQFSTAKASIASSQTAVKSAETALRGVRDEAFFGQRTTLDVLNAQQTLLNARVNLVTAQRDRVVASYAVLAAVGDLSLANLDAKAQSYDATRHFDAVKSRWIGVSTHDDQ